MAARLLSALLLLCLSPLAPALELIAATQSATACCCRGTKMCCCRRADRAPGWHSVPQCRKTCHGTPATITGFAALVAPSRGGPALRLVGSTALLLPDRLPRAASVHSPLSPRAPPVSA